MIFKSKYKKCSYNLLCCRFLFSNVYIIHMVNNQLYCVVLEAILNLHENWPWCKHVLMPPLWLCWIFPSKSFYCDLPCYYFFSFSALQFPMQRFRPFPDHLLNSELSENLDVLNIFYLKLISGLSQLHSKLLRSVQEWSNLFFSKIAEGVPFKV